MYASRCVSLYVSGGMSLCVSRCMYPEVCLSSMYPDVCLPYMYIEVSTMYVYPGVSRVCIPRYDSHVGIPRCISPVCIPRCVSGVSKLPKLPRPCPFKVKVTSNGQTNIINEFYTLHLVSLEVLHVYNTLENKKNR